VTLNIGSSLAGGISRVANRNGLLLMIAYLLIGAAWQIPFYSAVVTGLEQSGTPTENVALPAIDAPLAVSVSAAILLLLGLQWLTIVTIRTFVGGSVRVLHAKHCAGPPELTRWRAHIRGSHVRRVSALCYSRNHRIRRVCFHDRVCRSRRQELHRRLSG